MKNIMILSLLAIVACPDHEATSEEINDCCVCMAYKDFKGQGCLEDNEGRDDLVINRCWDEMSDGRSVNVLYPCLEDSVCGNECWFLDEV